jgi:hypothetical protein
VTGVPRNKLGLSAAGELETAEREITHAALIFLKESPVQPTKPGTVSIPPREVGDRPSTRCLPQWHGEPRTVRDNGL